MGTAEKLRAEAARHTAEARESFERCDTDGFLSQWASGINARLCETQAAIAENGGTAWFARWELVNAAGETMDARVCQTRFGERWRIDATDEWIKYGSAAAAARKGYTLIDRVERAEAYARIAAQGTGLSGAAGAYVAIERKCARRGDGWRSLGATDAEREQYDAWVVQSGIGLD